MDGTEDTQLFNPESDDEDPFDGFSAMELDTAEQYGENMMLDGNEYTDSESESDEFEEEVDPGSPGH